jgi:hypothetical protein
MICVGLNLTECVFIWHYQLNYEDPCFEIDVNVTYGLQSNGESVCVACVMLFYLYRFHVMNLIDLSYNVIDLKIWYYFFNSRKNLRHTYPNYVIYISLQRMLIYYIVRLSMCSKSWLVSHYWRWPWKSRAYSTKMANVRCWIQSKTGDGHRHIVHILCKPKRISLFIIVSLTHCTFCF